jgi:hypothetical protein
VLQNDTEKQKHNYDKIFVFSCANHGGKDLVAFVILYRLDFHHLQLNIIPDKAHIAASVCPVWDSDKEKLPV